ncbi:phosphoglucosamine mutase [Flavonifractor sp. An92]|uniref:phosphoglucosamine mutase n=1 Tax=Flavonifractor sp. An92 TaxID=1965666 RepID=UPI000B3AFFF1|nr:MULTISPECIES: phosphoglucosamine mutase [unclassified Flavonifractor]OUN05419.1 phosphoglucosamine mutase [Flavonifractor sp. An92]OUQ23511.1 phosphoglucosamine mutase [Flavonifractor sp. An135]
MGKLFGTDGIRGVVNAGLDATLAYQVGLAAAVVMAREKEKSRPLVAIGKDTRVSSDLLECALIAGLCSAGADVLRLGVVPTPAVAWLTVDSGADAGIVISASHNPFEHNGIKVFNSQGYKLRDELENAIEEIVLSGNFPTLQTGGDLGRVIPGEDLSEKYLDHLASTIQDDLAGMRVLVDCANGAASATAPGLFRRFPKLHADIIHAQPNGVNINNGCGSTHLDDLKARVVEGEYQLGLAYDGDADRFLAVDEKGQDIDGDQIMAACARVLQQEGKLNGNTMVGTVMSNLGLHRFAADNGMQLLCTPVGDRNVLEKMLEGDFVIGGEQSGHTIFRAYATTGDGELTSLQFLQVLHRAGCKASELVADCKRYPQVLVNLPVESKEKKESIMASQALKDAVAAKEAALAGCGRVLVRPSGTEALLRVMVEAATTEEASACAEELANVIKNL